MSLLSGSEFPPPSDRPRWHQLESPLQFPSNTAGSYWHLLSVSSQSLKQKEGFIVPFKVFKRCF